MFAREVPALDLSAISLCVINDNEFLFDVMQDPLERANLAKRQAAVFRDMKNAWVTWNGTMLPIPPKAYSHGVTPAHQADHYAPKGMD